MRQPTTIAAVMMMMLGFTAFAGLAQAGSTPAGSAFTYQGLLTSGGAPATGSFHLRFQLWNALTGGSQVGSDVNAPAVMMDQGRFTTPLDFGSSAFDGSARWLQVQVVGDGGATVTTLSPRQPISPTPYSISTHGIAVDDTGKVGIGTDAPTSMLSVAGDADISGAVRLGNSAAACAPATSGTVRWNGSSLEYCNGSAWQAVPGPRRIFFVAGQFEDNTDNGVVASRTVLVTKASATSKLRVTWSDNIRVFGANIASTWEVRFNGLSAPSGPIRTSLYQPSSANTHMPVTLVGYATGLAAGNYTVQVYVGPAPGYPVNDAYTGWNTRYLLEVEEIP